MGRQDEPENGGLHQRSQRTQRETKMKGEKMGGLWILEVLCNGNACLVKTTKVFLCVLWCGYHKYEQSRYGSIAVFRIITFPFSTPVPAEQFGEMLRAEQ